MHEYSVTMQKGVCFLLYILLCIQCLVSVNLIRYFLCAIQSVIGKEEKAKVVELQTDVPCPPGGSSTASTSTEDVSILYDNFGDHSHQAEVKRVNKMLDSNKLLLDGPSDLSLLLDWSGWMLAPKEVV